MIPNTLSRQRKFYGLFIKCSKKGIFQYIIKKITKKLLKTTVKNGRDYGK